MAAAADSAVWMEIMVSSLPMVLRQEKADSEAAEVSASPGTSAAAVQPMYMGLCLAVRESIPSEECSIY